MTYRILSALLAAFPCVLATPDLSAQFGLHLELGVRAPERPRVHVALGGSVGVRARHHPKRAFHPYGRVVAPSCHPSLRCTAHLPVVRYKKVWVPPVYRNIYVGRDCYGRPVYRRVCVEPGYYQKVPVSRRCSRCGVGLSGSVVVYR